MKPSSSRLPGTTAYAISLSLAPVPTQPNQPRKRNAAPRGGLRGTVSARVIGSSFMIVRSLVSVSGSKGLCPAVVMK